MTVTESTYGKIDTKFVGFSDDGERVRYENITESARRDRDSQAGFYRVMGSYDALVGARRRITRFYGNNREDAYRLRYPLHIVSLRRLANDSPLPELDYDHEAYIFSFAWKPMLDMFFGEPVLTRRWMAQHAEAQRSRLTNAGTGEVDFQQLYEIFDGLLADVMKVRMESGIKIRHRRLRLFWERYRPNEEVPDSEGGLFDDGVYCAAYHKVREFAEDLKWVEFSDDDEPRVI